MIKVGIIGGAGYAAGELIRVLLNHPEAEIVFVNSSSNAGNLLTDVHEGLYGETTMHFTKEYPFDEVDVVFFCFGHGKSTQFLKDHQIPSKVAIIDLAQDFRLEAEGNDFVYGLPELNKEKIKNAQHIANPGCFATCIQLGLLPLAKENLIHGDVSVNAITGSSGAGVMPKPTTHFSWRCNNISVYKAFRHQHIPEIKQSVKQLESSFDSDIEFLPYRGDFPRGIFASEVLHVDPSLDIEKVRQLYRDFYADAPFTHYIDKDIDMKQVINTNKVLMHVDKIDNKLLVTICQDNLLKGASGQAVQNMNLMFGIDEKTGLMLKSQAF